MHKSLKKDRDQYQLTYEGLETECNKLRELLLEQRNSIIGPLNETKDPETTITTAITYINRS